MDNEAQTAAQATDADAPLINPGNTVEAPEATTEAPMPLYDNSEAQQPQAEFTTDDEPLERPDYYPEQFWDEDGPNVEELAKSYNELRTKFSQGKHKAPDGDYEYAALAEQGLDAEEPGFQIFSEWAKENGVSQAAFEELGQKILSVTKQEAEAVEIDRQQEMAKLGDRAAEKIAMVERLIAKAPLTNEEQQNLAVSLDSADSINAFIKYHQALTNEGIPITPAINSPSMTKEDLESAIADPRWTTDASFRGKIEKQWMEANS